jgi:uncharacterized OB-fold protein
MTVGPVSRNDATAEFFDGTSRQEFLLKRCRDGHFSEPMTEQCTTCGGRALVWVPASGLAIVVSWTITYGKSTSILPDDRRLLVIAELAEGPWWWSEIVDSDPGALELGARLHMEFRRYDEQSETVPVFVLGPD